MDSIEHRYCVLKTLTCVSLLIGLMLTFGSLLSRESWELEKMAKVAVKRMRKFNQ